MIQFTLNNEKILAFIHKTPVLKYFFVPHISYLDKIENQTVKDFTQKMFYVSSGTSRQTLRDRFASIDEISIEYIKNIPQPIIHDVAVSSGITSFDLYHKLKNSRVAFEMYISDKFSMAYWQTGWVDRVFDASGNMMWGYFMKMVLNPRLPYFGLSKLLFYLFEQSKKNSELAQLRPIWLYDPQVVELLRTEQVKHLYYDLFESQLENKFNFVRVMNVLNLNYFSEKQIKLAFGNILQSLAPDAVVQVGRTLPDGVNQVSFFRVNPDKKIVLDRQINGGSEIAHIFLEINP